MDGWHSYARTHRGNRRSSNEDSVLAHPGIDLWVVADGMGGHVAGGVASQAITDTLRDLLGEADLGELVDRVEDALLEVNLDLRQQAGEGETIGSTVVVMLADGDVGVALWAGDSRLYRSRDAEVALITRDHNPISDLAQEGFVTDSLALRTDTNVITRAIGGQADLALDVALFDIRKDDTFLLCSDGLYREVTDQQILDALRAKRVESAADVLIETCLAGEARDNVSVVVNRPVGGNT